VVKVPDYLLDVKNLKKYFETPGGYIRAIDGVDFSIKKKDSVGVVGESGCGKSTLAKLLTRLIEPDSGQIYFCGKDILKIPKREMRAIRKRMQIVFQDPFSSLNPKMTISDIVGRPLEIHGLCKTKHEKEEKVSELLELVGLSKRDVNKYPREFSGGQRQRIAIARALSTNPEFVILDEPTSALDVSVQARILNLLNDLREKFKITYLFISHDFSVVKYTSKRIIVMYAGKIVEWGPTNSLLSCPAHPYTQTLLSAVISYGFKFKKKIPIVGEPSLFGREVGCSFCTRCPYKKDICDKETPPFLDIGKNHFVRCHLY
jgi:oligopeptide/dipeptide ABC transporter ATP-binding protein